MTAEEVTAEARVVTARVVVTAEATVVVATVGVRVAEAVTCKAADLSDLRACLTIGSVFALRTWLGLGSGLGLGLGLG